MEITIKLNGIALETPAGNVKVDDIELKFGDLNFNEVIDRVYELPIFIEEMKSALEGLSDFEEEEEAQEETGEEVPDLRAVLGNYIHLMAEMEQFAKDQGVVRGFGIGAKPDPEQDALKSIIEAIANNKAEEKDVNDAIIGIISAITGNPDKNAHPFFANYNPNYFFKTGK